LRGNPTRPSGRPARPALRPSHIAGTKPAGSPRARYSRCPQYPCPARNPPDQTASSRIAVGRFPLLTTLFLRRRGRQHWAVVRPVRRTPRPPRRPWHHRAGVSASPSHTTTPSSATTRRPQREEVSRISSSAAPARSHRPYHAGQTLRCPLLQPFMSKAGARAVFLCEPHPGHSASAPGPRHRQTFTRRWARQPTLPASTAAVDPGNRGLPGWPQRESPPPPVRVNANIASDVSPGRPSTTREFMSSLHATRTAPGARRAAPSFHGPRA